MNCQTARETLELARPDAPDATTVAEAAQHVSGCVSCRTAVRQREDFDIRISGLCGDVPLPVGLKERLLAGLEASVQSEITTGGVEVAPGGALAKVPEVSTALPATRPAASTASVARQVGSRRRWLGAASLTAAVLVAVGIGTWSLWPVRPSVDLEEITGVMATDGIDPANLAVFKTFTGGEAPQPPATMLTSRLVSPPRRLGNLDAAVYFFTLPGRGGPLDGRLAVIPRRFVQSAKLPSATSFQSGTIAYPPGFCTTAWVEGKFVYVCCLSGSGSGLHQLVPPRPQPA